jgi:hypothetical protein
MVDAGQRAKLRRQVRPAPRVVIVVGPSAHAGRAYRVDAPDRVLRMFELLTAARDELDLAALAARDRARIQRLLDVVRAEIERSVSPALADELRNLVCVGERVPNASPAAPAAPLNAAPDAARGASRDVPPGAAPDAAQLRMEYASLLGWVSGLVVAMLDQLANARDQPVLLGSRPEAP